MVIEVDSFRDASSGDGEQDRPSPVLARALVIVESEARLGRILSLDEQQLVQS